MCSNLSGSWVLILRVRRTRDQVTHRLVFLLYGLDRDLPAQVSCGACGTRKATFWVLWLIPQLSSLLERTECVVPTYNTRGKKNTGNRQPAGSPHKPSGCMKEKRLASCRPALSFSHIQPWKVPDNSKNSSSALLGSLYYQEQPISPRINSGQRQVGLRHSL